MRVVDSSEALSIPDISEVCQVLFLKSCDLMGMPQSRMLGVLVRINYLPECSLLAAAGVECSPKLRHRGKELSAHFRQNLGMAQRPWL